MNGPSTSSVDFDAIRAAHPELAINLYAMTPGGAVTLEIITPDGETFQWSAETATMAFLAAFPPATPTPREAPPPETGSIFD